MKNNHNTIFRLILIVVCGLQANAQQYDTLKIAPPPGGGVYIGQYEWVTGHVDTFETVIGQPTAWFGRIGSMDVTNHGFPVFDAADANLGWQNGKVTLVHAIEAGICPDDQLNGEQPVGFTIDKLLSGDYDTTLVRLSNEFLNFGKPMFFHTSREPLGIGFEYMGGFGPNGDKSVFWAIQNNTGLNDFNPSTFPNVWLYSDLGDPQVSDGVERLVAAQRYYKHIFDSLGCKFLTFETMGYPVFGPDYIEQEIEGAIADYPNADSTLIKKLYQSSFDFANYYPGDAYADWISINFYTLDYYVGDWTGLTQNYFVSTAKYLSDLDYNMEQIRLIAPDKPIMFLEFGLPDGRNKDSQRAAERVDSVFNHIITNCPEINGISMWSWHPSWMIPDNFPFDCLIRPNTRQGAALKQIIDDNPGYFHSGVYFSDGSLHPFVTGIKKDDNIYHDNKITVYSNHSKNHITIKFDYDLNIKYRLKMYNLSGRLILKNENIESNQVSISKQGLGKGLFLFVLSANNKTIANRKLILE